MDAPAFLAALRTRGVALTVNGDRLRWIPRDALAPDEVDLLRQHKSLLLRLLSDSVAPLELVSELARSTPPASSMAAKLPSTATEPKRPGLPPVGLSRPLALAHASCGAHLDPSQWHREPVADRPGWELATCRRCGKPIGWNPVAKAANPDLRALKKQRTTYEF